MSVFERAKASKKSIVTIISVSLCAVLLLSAFTSASGSGQTAAEAVYRESTVQRGDITVGVTETATATLKTHSLSFDVKAGIEEVFVKAGQEVKEGDPIASISTDLIMEELSTLSADYQEAALKLSEAQLAKQKGDMTATSDYKSTLTKSGSAASTYDMTVENLELAVTKAQKSVADIKMEIRTYNTILGYSFGNYTDGYYNDYEDSSYYDAKYDKDFEDEDDVETARDDAKDRLIDAENDLKTAEYNLEIQSPEAVLTKEETESKAELASTTYEMEMQSLTNSVTSKQLAMKNIQDQIDKYNGYLANTVITSPCDGVVASVSYSAGDEVAASTAVATISDSNNVFVYAAVTQDDITGITLGQACTVDMDAFENLAFDGTVDSVTTTPARSASSSASYNVTIKLEGDTAQVYEGMTGSATLITRQQKDVLYVTNRTVYQKDSASYVKVKLEDETIVETLVTTGFSDGRNVEITSGLEEGQTVLIESQVAAQA